MRVESEYKGRGGLVWTAVEERCSESEKKKTGGDPEERDGMTTPATVRLVVHRYSDRAPPSNDMVS